MGRLLFTLIVFAVLSGGGYFAYTRFIVLSPDGGHGGGSGGRPTYVVTVPVSQDDFSIRLEAVGTAKANESITVTAKTTDTISAINFRDGQSVPKGFVIAEMTSTQQSAQLADARAALAEAENQFDRAQQLIASGNASSALMDQRRASRDSALARVQAQESQVSDRLIRAPFAGVLGLRQASVGSLVRPGDPITTLDDVSIIKLDLTVAETNVAALKDGLPVTAAAAGYPGKVLQGSITGIDSRVDPVARTVLARAEIANPDGVLKPGMLLSARIDADLRRSLSVPEECIVALADERFVYVIGADNKAERRKVKTGRRKPGIVEVLEGLRMGERIVTEGVVKLRPDAPVTLKVPKLDRGGERPQKHQS